VTVPAGDGGALEALARYCLRNPVSLARLRWALGSATATYLETGRRRANRLVLTLPGCTRGNVS